MRTWDSIYLKLKLKTAKEYISSSEKCVCISDANFRTDL